MHRGYLKARMDDVRACERSAGSPTAREDRGAILGALADLGFPENAYVQDPSRPRTALYLYRADDGRHEFAYAPWRLARHAPPGMPPKDVRSVGRDLRRGFLWSVFGLAAASLGVLFTLLVARMFVPPPPESLSPAAYLHAAPVIFACAAALCAVAVLWHLIALLFPHGDLAEDAESRAAFGRALDRQGEGV